MERSSWEPEWDKNASKLQNEHPLKVLKHPPNIPDITPETKKNLKLKALFYLLAEDQKKIFLRHFLRRPIKNSWGLIRSYLHKRRYVRKGDYFFYGLENMEEFERRLKEKNTFLTVGYSYCHKPLECPSGRFSDQCQADPDHPVCGQCFIGKCKQFPLNPDSHRTLIIPTVHYIGEKMFEILKEHPKKKHLFLITACGMTLEMFADWGNAIGIEGLGVRLGGRICNTMRAFELSEEGIKPGLTTVSEEVKEKMLELLRARSS